MKSNNRFKIAGLATIGLKALQGIGRDLSYLFEKGSNLSKYSFGGSEIAKSGASLAGGIAITEGIGQLEKAANIPKPLRGALPLTAATIGAGTLVHFYGDTFGIEQGTGILNSTSMILDSYIQSAGQLLKSQPYNANALSLAGASTTAYSTGKLAYNFGKAVSARAKQQEARDKQRQLETEVA